MRIRTRLLLSILLTSVVVFVGIISYLSTNYYKTTLHEAKRMTDLYAAQNSNTFKLALENDKALTTALAESFSLYKQVPNNDWENMYSDLLSNILRRHPNYLSVWMTWELSAVNEQYTKPNGRMRKIFYRTFDGISRITKSIDIQQDTVDIDGDAINGLYYKSKSAKSGMITDPYLYSYSEGQSAENFLEMSVGSAIIADSAFVGLVGVDIAIDHFQEIAKNIKPFKNSYAFLVASNGTLITYPQSSHLNLPIDSVLPADIQQDIVVYKQKIATGEAFSFIHKKNYQSIYYTFQPIKFSEKNSNWSLAIVVPIADIMADYMQQLNIIIVVGLVGMLILILSTTIMSHTITMPLKIISDELKKLNNADVQVLIKQREKYKGEMGYIARAAITLINWLNETADFAKQISEGNYNVKYQLMGSNDELGKSLEEIRNKLAMSKNAELKLRDEEQKNNWINESIADFALVLRHISTIDELGQKVITSLVQTLNYQQGVFFIINDKKIEDTYIQLIASYGISEERENMKRFQKDKGILGRCLTEDKTIIVTDAPPEYTKISSGLGSTSSANIVVSPLKYDEKIYGLIELSSIRSIAPHEISFLNKVGESIAVALLNTINNIKNERLIKESRKKTEELAEKEEQMRVQYEELEETQEEMNRKQLELESALLELEKSKSELEKEKIAKEERNETMMNTIKDITTKQLTKTKIKVEQFTIEIENLKKELKEKDELINELKNK